ncbi:hypothetical protein [Aquibacillus saliphilus]|uniref:hypothetical protein n=1 Tax=Aquibacillus saliphilus TaxID=1909422 RepID=UPI001CEFE416|nr:hypothetical protein [Aquibacillus saliphilus]
MKTLDDVLKEMEEIENDREDIDLSLNTLNMRDDGIIQSRTYGEFNPSEVTIKKLCNLYKLNHSHMKTLVNEGRYDLVSSQFNHFLSGDDRMMKMRTVQGNRIKGFVGMNYKKFDDYDLFNLVNDYLVDNELDYDVKILNKDDEHTRIRLMLNDVDSNMGMAHENGIDYDIVQGGIEITNSEIGSNGIGLNSLVYRQVCSNGMMGLIGDEDNKEIFHKRGNDFSPFARRNSLNSGIEKAVDQSNNSIKLFERTKNIEVKNPKEEFNRISSRYKLGQHHVSSLMDMYSQEPQENYYGIINAISRHADRNFKTDYKNRAKFEFMASDILNKVAN